MNGCDALPTTMAIPKTRAKSRTAKNICFIKLYFQNKYNQFRDSSGTFRYFYGNYFMGYLSGMGRDPDKKRLDIQITSSDYEKLAALAASQKRSIRNMVEVLISEKLAGQNPIKKKKP